MCAMQDCAVIDVRYNLDSLAGIEVHHDHMANSGSQEQVVGVD